MSRETFCKKCGFNLSLHRKDRCPPISLAAPASAARSEDAGRSWAWEVSVVKDKPPEKGDANDVQVGGDHYKVGGEEHWDRVARLNLDYFQGQITKYVERWRKKNGVQDLQKAAHFLDKYIELVVNGKVK